MQRSLLVMNGLLRNSFHINYFPFETLVPFAVKLYFFGLTAPRQSRGLGLEQE